MSTVAKPLMIAPWLIAGAMQDGIDLWFAGGKIQWHGPQESRLKWAGVMHRMEVPLRAYLELEVWPGGR